MTGPRNLWSVLVGMFMIHSGRVETENANNPRYRFRKIPALDENDESNFQYDYGKGFSTEYYRKMRDRLDKNEWMAKYQQRPFIREGLLFPLDELNYYNGVLPDGDCITAAACDVAWGGGDSLSMPFGKLFGSVDDGPIYIPDWIFNKGDKYVTKPLVVQRRCNISLIWSVSKLITAGMSTRKTLTAYYENKALKLISLWAKASNQVGKMAKIIQYAPDIKRRCYFLKPELQSQEYKAAMEELGIIVQVGKNEHEDSADGLTQLIQVFENGTVKTTIINSPM